MTFDEMLAKYGKGNVKQMYIDPQEHPAATKKYAQMTRPPGRTKEERWYPQMTAEREGRKELNRYAKKQATPEERAYPGMPTVNRAETPIRRADDQTVNAFMAYPSLWHRYSGWQVENPDGTVDIMYQTLPED